MLDEPTPGQKPPHSPGDAQNPTKISWQVLAPAVSLSSLAVFLVGIRWYTRRSLMGKVGVDDWLITLSVILSLGMTIAIAIQFFQKVQVVPGRNEWGDVAVVIAPTVAKLVLVNNVLYSAVTNLTKGSIVAQYLRIFEDVRMRRACYLTLFLLFAAAMYGIFAGIFICVPVKKFWAPRSSGHCENANTLWLAAAGMNIMMDWTVWILPMPVISQLKLPRKQMIGVVAVFFLGGFVCATSIVRLVLVHTAAMRQEHTKAGVGSITWSAIEANVGIICASLMSIKPLIVRFFPKLLVDDGIPSHHARLPTVSDFDTSTWARGSVSTTCTRSHTPDMLSFPSMDSGIKVTTRFDKSDERKRLSQWLRNSVASSTPKRTNQFL